MKLKILTHERIVFDSDVDEIVIQSTNGQIGILPNHIPFTTALAIGIAKTKIGESYKYFAIMGGIFQFKDNYATILTDICENEADIDITRAKAAKERAEVRLSDSSAKVDAERAQAALARSLARLQVALRKQ